jgi:hypothetical protein
MSVYHNPLIDLVYKSFVNYFNNPLLTKVNQTQDFKSIYAVKIKCHLIGVYRYLLVIVSNDSNQLGTHKNLCDLNWQNLQTRTFTKDPYQITTHSYIPQNTDPMNQKIVNIASKSTDKLMYYDATLFPLNIILLYTPKNTYYSKTGTLAAAIESYESLITFHV